MRTRLNSLSLGISYNLFALFYTPLIAPKIPLTKFESQEFYAVREAKASGGELQEMSCALVQACGQGLDGGLAGSGRYCHATRK